MADAVAELARNVDAELVAVAGDVRAQMLILESLPTDVATVAVRIEAGAPEGIAADVVRLLSSKVAERVTAAAEEVRAGVANGVGSTDPAAVIDALGEGRVAKLLVHDDGGTTDDHAEADGRGGRLVDRAIAAALATDAEIIVVPNLAVMDGPIAATLRW